MTNGSHDENKGIKFVSGGRARSVTYVIRPSVPERDPLTGRQIGTTKALRAEFKEHVFHSKSGQRAGQWTDEERKAVERYLLSHPDFGRGDGRGIFLDSSGTLAQDVPQDVLPAHMQQITPDATSPVPMLSGEQCQWFSEEGDETVQCSDLAMKESEFCALHAGMMASAGVE